MEIFQENNLIKSKNLKMIFLLLKMFTDIFPPILV